MKCAKLSFSQALSPFGAAMAGPLEDGVAAAERGDYATALHLIRPLAKRRDAAAQLALGGMFDTGKGVSQDYGQAHFSAPDHLAGARPGKCIATETAIGAVGPKSNYPATSPSN
jgi:TPR repeat protein